MDAARIAELLQPFFAAPQSVIPSVGRSFASERSAAVEGPSVSLSLAQLNNISTYIDLLLRWNARINLTSVRDPEQIVTRHFGESLFAARILRDAGVLAGANQTLADLGSGAGFPGIPIKLLAPDLDLTLIESQNKK